MLYLHGYRRAMPHHNEPSSGTQNPDDVQLVYMLKAFLRPCLAALSLLAAVACTALGEAGGPVTVSIRAEFEKVGATGGVEQNGQSGSGGQAELRPARHCWAEVLDATTGGVISGGYLDAEGSGVAQIPRGTDFQVRLLARYEAPGKNGFGNFRMRGSVKKGRMQATYGSADAFDAIPDWSLTSEARTAARDSSITIRALDSGKNIEGRAFNIAYQAVGFALQMGELEPGLALPDMHTFWTPESPYTDYPGAAFDKQHRPLAHMGGRTIFQHGVMGAGGRRAGDRGDECNDTALMASFARMLFADYSFPAVNPDHPYGRIARRDCEEIALVGWRLPSDSTAAFVGGFCDFLSAAFTGGPSVVDISSGGVKIVDLSVPTSFPKEHGGEHYRQSVASALYRVWADALGGSRAALKTMWAATYAQGMALGVDAVSTAYPYGYLQCPVGNISSYLSGLANGGQFGVTPRVWGNVLKILESESMSDPVAAHFDGGAFWKVVGGSPVSEHGAIKTYPDEEGIFWDMDQSAAYLFTLGADGGQLGLDMVGGQDLFLELFDGQGIVEECTAPSNVPSREINMSGLAPGPYLARVRAGNTTQEKTAHFKLSVRQQK